MAGSLLLNVQMFAGKARCMSEDAPELTAELVVDGAVPLHPVISPDGRWVAYAVAPVGMRGRASVCARSGSPPLTGAHRRRKLTAGTADRL